MKRSSKLSKKYQEAWAIFVLGLSLDDVSSQAQVPKPTVKQWSVKDRWLERREKIFAARLEKLGAQVLNEQESIKGQERAFAEKLMALAERALTYYTPARVRKVNATDLVKILELASKLSRLSAGMPLNTATVDIGVRHDLSDSIKLALSKVYGEPIKAIEVATEPAKLENPL